MSELFKEGGVMSYELSVRNYCTNRLALMLCEASSPPLNAVRAVHASIECCARRPRLVTYILSLAAIWQRRGDAICRGLQSDNS
jgi:hypothetical protein